MNDNRIRRIITIRESLWNKLKELGESQNRTRNRMLEWIVLEAMGVPPKTAQEMSAEKLSTKEEEHDN